MKDEIFSVLQRVGRSFMLPVAVLPIAGILLGIGASFTNLTTTIKTYGLEAIFGDGTILGGLLTIMASARAAPSSATCRLSSLSALPSAWPRRNVRLQPSPL